MFHHYFIIIISLYESTAGEKSFPTFFIHLYRLPVHFQAIQVDFFLSRLSTSSLSGLLSLPSLGIHSAVLVVYLISVCLAHVHVFLLIVFKMCSTLVCFLIHDVLFLSLHVMPNNILSIPL